MPIVADPHRVLVAADVDSPGRRDNAVRYRAQLGFQEIMKVTCDEFGLDRADRLLQRAGDGELAIMPLGTDERAIVGRLTATVDRHVRAHNRDVDPDERIRLRIGIHAGPVYLDGARGFPGEAVVTVCRMVDSPRFAEALRRFPAAGVAFIVSDRIYRTAVRRHDGPGRFEPVGAAWMYVPGANS